MSDDATREVAGLVGAVLFGGASAVELVRMLTLRVPWPGFNMRIDWVFGAIAVALWVASAYVLATRNRKHRPIAVAGTFALFAYGLLGTIARSHYGMIYVAFAVMLPLIERLAFGGRLSLGRGAGEPIRPSSGREII